MRIHGQVKSFIRAILTRKDVTKGARLLLCYMASFRGRLKWSEDRAAKDLGVSLRSIQEWMRELDQKGLVSYRGREPNQDKIANYKH